ncbi:hypothetical protein P4S72_00750 [Vibrio sp. PP-XX7]
MSVSDLDDKAISKIARGKIYSNIYGRRIDERPVKRLLNAIPLGMEYW